MMDVRLSLLVADDTHFYRMGAKIAHEQPVLGLERLLLLAEKLSAKHVWVLAGTEVSRLASVPCDELPGWSLRSMTVRNHIAWVSAVRKGARFEEARIQIGFCEYAPWPWDKREDPRTVLATIAYLEDTLGVSMEWTPAHVALDFIRMRNADRWAWFSPLTIDLAKEQEGFTYGQTCKEIHWSAGLAPDKRYLIKGDGNSRYGATMTGLDVGEGNPKHVWKPGYDGQMPGFWRVQWDKGESLFDGDRLPDLGSEWMTTDMVEMLRRKAGYTIDIVEGWRWEKYHQSLRSTVSDKDKKGLWDLRLAWRALRGKSAAHENVYASISAVLHTVHGKLGDPDISDKRFYRPDMYAMVVARSIALMVYHIEKIRGQYGLLPCAQDVDALWYGVDDPHMLDEMLSSEKLGGFKHVYTLEINDEVRAAFAAKTPTQVVAMLNKIHDRSCVN